MLPDAAATAATAAAAAADAASLQIFASFACKQLSVVDDMSGFFFKGV